MSTFEIRFVLVHREAWSTTAEFSSFSFSSQQGAMSGKKRSNRAYLEAHDSISCLILVMKYLLRTSVGMARSQEVKLGTGIF
jgi:hypothetical protein